MTKKVVFVQTPAELSEDATTKLESRYEAAVKDTELDGAKFVVLTGGAYVVHQAMYLRSPVK